ncbi:type I polyketide synthase [Streptomyces sp. Isolate_45]|uniref:type I polyketide synthase n=1 Tax=Streptomyces sp. Isolate_45 TaxID=2950111 RepID=UPI002481B357|nr:type I polyketide synthase [Streptomyces sp. Isolate_45]MDA5280147.1 SDR family oxidoreductase [Streptomyces sp. Isolate_45]
MTSAEHVLDLVIGLTPFGEPDARLAAAVTRGGGLGVLDLGGGDRAARKEWDDLRRWLPGRHGVRVGPRCRLPLDDLVRDGAPPHTVVLGVSATWSPGALPRGVRVLAEVTGADGARAALDAGVHGLIARGGECGGRIGELGTFVLLQQLLDMVGPDGPPVWACGGMAPGTAAAAVVGGAAGVVLDTQLALLAESAVPESVATVLRGMDGSETTVLAGHRFLHRRAPGPRPADELPDDPARVAALLGGRDPDGQLLPVGQDAFLAARFADRHGDAASAVRAVTEAVLAAVEEDRAADVLRPGSAMSRALGTRLPIAQGPMTRVSDGVDFARAVADDGALPFLALALAGGDQARALLAEAGTALAGRPWGVGVLGFAPEETRTAQLEAVRAHRPTHVIIAGGRPSQARALEDDGIKAFLHVPSPGLLRQFLEQGARRFVFEGAECGGHVGPRNSFPLWEAQLAVIGDWLDENQDRTQGSGGQPGPDRERGPHGTAGIEVFLAGGIHDARSAAMAAALAAPLTSRGCAVGVLMGTAYLFTEEAVACGAVRPLFQRQVIAAERTALLRTAPGHATRCVPSPFSDGFQGVEAALRAEGVPGREIWERLERLNVGRLRMASKGVERTGAGILEPVDESRQYAEGMFMAGEVAVLRSSTTTVAALHASVTDGAVGHLDRRAADLRGGRAPGLAPTADASVSEPAPAPLDVAIVGMACMFPQAPDLAAFWGLVLDGRDAVTEVPPERWDPAVHHSPGPGAASASKWGGFLPRIPFDPLRYGIPPASLGNIEPVQLLALESARRALEDAGYGEDGRAFDRTRAGVVFGAEAGSDLSNATTLRAVLPSYYGHVPPELDDQLPRFTEDTFPGMLANVISGRVANRLDLRGANYTVDAACASSLAAVDAACKELVLGSSDLMLCGGADLHNGINDYALFTSVHALSPTGRSRPFDAGADGIVLGEGVACVVLKRLADAERDGDRVYGVIKGVGSSSDGRSLGLTAPRPEGQRAALERAYRNAGVSPAQVTLVEAHGTGTVVGDRTELGVLTEVFSEAGAASGACVLGSVKSQIGHTKCAAGLAGLIKTALALHTGVRPPTLHLERPVSAWKEGESPFVFHREALPWPAASERRLAGLSAFGFGGTNFHVVLAAHGGDGPPPVHSRDDWPAELFTFRGTTAAAARRAAAELLDLAVGAESGAAPWRLRDLAATAAHRAARAQGPVRASFVAHDPADLCRRLGHTLHALDARTAPEDLPPGTTPLPAAATGLPAPEVHLAERAADGGPGLTAFLFPGQGSQRPGMSAHLFTTFPELGRLLDTGGGAHVPATLHPPASFDDAGRERDRRALTDTRAAQPALGIVELAAYDVLTRSGVRPDLAAGHSYGELVALCAAGVIDADALPGLSAARAAAVLGAAGDDPGAMVAAAATPEEVERALGTRPPEGLVLANHNAPRQSVLSGPTAAVDAALRSLRDAGLGAKRLPVACAFHSPLLAAAGPVFRQALEQHPLRAPEFPVWANRTARPYEARADAVRDELAAQIGSPVRFVAQIEAMYEAGARTFVEVGPGRVLTRLVADILGDRPHRVVACEPRPGSGLPDLLDALARLAAGGLPVVTDWMFRGRDAVDIDRTPAPRRPGWTVDGHLVRTAAGETLPGALAPARRVVEIPVTTHPGQPPAGTADALVAEFLRTSRDMIAAQRDVLLAYFGTAPEVGSPVGRTAPPPEVRELPQLPAAPAGYAGPYAAPYAEPPTTAGAVPPPAVAAEAAGGAGGAGALTEEGVLRTVLELISERTGYPLDMVEPDLDLEADLSVDSIKRAEIAGELARRLGAFDGSAALSLDDAELEELTRARTASAIAHWLVTRVAGPSGVEATARDGGPTPDDASAAEPAPTPTPTPHDAPDEQPRLAAPRRFRMLPVPLPEPERGPGTTGLAGARYTLVGDGTGVFRGVAAELSARLTRLGAEPVVVGADHAPSGAEGPVDGVFVLTALGEDGAPFLPAGFPLVRDVLRGGPRRLFLAHAVDGVRAAGVDGLSRSAAREYPAVGVRSVGLDLGAGESPAGAADALVAELLADDAVPVVLRTPAGRFTTELTGAPLGALGATGAGPAGEGAAEVAALGLDRESVVVLVGGARGITARCAVALATASRCRIELLGRTPVPDGPEDPQTSGAVDRAALRAVLAGTGRHGTPAEIDRAADLVLARREVIATLAALNAAGSRARYRSVDCREAPAVLQAVKEIHAEHGRVDGVVHAAGIIEDRLMEEKSAASFGRVYGTKTESAAALLAAVEQLPRPPSFAVLFGSIAAVLGNRGQADYAAANDALEAIGSAWAARTGGRALTVHWGPWAPSEDHAGMVGPELARHYAQRGITLIDPEEGALALLRELAWGEETVRSVVHTASEW